MSVLKTLNHLYSNSFMVFLNDPSLIRSTLHYTTPLSQAAVTFRLIKEQTIASILMMLNFSNHYRLWISLKTSLTLKTL